MLIYYALHALTLCLIVAAHLRIARVAKRARREKQVRQFRSALEGN